MTTTPKITPAALRYLANEFACFADDPVHRERLKGVVRSALERAADELEGERPPHWSRAQWCAPGDAQQDVWLIRFDDPDMQTPVFAGDNAEAEARAAWERHCGPNQGAYNGYLFRLVRREA